MIKHIYESFLEYDIKVQCALISAFVTIILSIFGHLYNFFKERYNLNYKLKKEFKFEQIKKLREEISKNKIPLLNAAEDLNKRLINFNINIDEKWHEITKEQWCKDNTQYYYIRSFVYRFLVFLYWVKKTEEDTFSIDSTIAQKRDKRFHKFIKTFKLIFCSKELIEKLTIASISNTEKEHSRKIVNKNHFFRNKIENYLIYVTEEWDMEDGKKGIRVINYEDFIYKSLNEYDKLEKLIEYFSNITNDEKNPKLNVLRCLQIVLIEFLNEFGHSYHKMKWKDRFLLYLDYRKKIVIRKEFRNFCKQNNMVSRCLLFLTILKIPFFPTKYGLTFKILKL